MAASAVVVECPVAIQERVRQVGPDRALLDVVKELLVLFVIGAKRWKDPGCERYLFSVRGPDGLVDAGSRVG